MKSCIVNGFSTLILTNNDNISGDSSVEIPQRNLLAWTKKSTSTGIKTYFYKDSDNNEVEITSYMMKTPYQKRNKNKDKANNKLNPVLMGEGQHAKVYIRYNPNSDIVKKQFISRYGDPLNPYRLSSLINLHTNRKFRQLNLARFICLPFQLAGKEEFIYMKKIPGPSLKELSIDEKGKQHMIVVTKCQVISLLKAIIRLTDDEDLNIVHTDIHAGNILITKEGALVLIDFDECISTINKYTPRMVMNEEYIENPTNEDYLNGYNDKTSKLIPAAMTCEEEDFYQSQGSYNCFRDESIDKYKNIFVKNGRTLFDDEEFKQTHDEDYTKVFFVQIGLHQSFSDSENY